MLRNPPRANPKGRPKEKEKRHKPLVELREEAKKKRQKKAAEPKQQKPVDNNKKNTRVKKCPYCNEEGHTVQTCSWMQLAKEADAMRTAGIELKL
jgi:hypothetical protein